jgi:hypothetical protein
MKHNCPNDRVKGCSLLVSLLLMFAPLALPQSNPSERSFPESKATLEKMVNELRSTMSGKLPTLEGFAQASEQPLVRYKRGYFDLTVHVTSAPSGGSVVRVSAKVTAWLDDSTAGRSGYRELPSNGRLEADLLDQLSERLAASAADQHAKPPVATKAEPPPASSRTSDSLISAPMPAAAQPKFSSGSDVSLLKPTPPSAAAPSKDIKPNSLETEAANLESVLKSQAHPHNLVAVKKAGTPVVNAASLNAKTILLASAHDEFELLAADGDWVHVRIAGPQRGWIWRDSVEMPDGTSAMAPAASARTVPAAVDLFQVTREETAQFPGDWEPLRGKSVKIISVEKVKEASKDTGPRERLEFAKFVLDKNLPEVSKKSPPLSGLVLIFDAVDGGMLAAPLPALQDWKAGTLTDSALWHRCFFDPPETFIFAGSAGGSR